MVLSKSVHGDRCLKILLVDDNHTSLTLLESILKPTEYDTHSVDSGEKALDYLEKHPGEIDLLLLDRLMPGMNGLEVCAAMKADSQLKNIPVIMQTAASDPDDVIEGISAGVFYYLTKPLNSGMLLSVIEAAVRNVQQFKRLHQEMQERQGSYRLISSLQCNFRTFEEVFDLTSFLANLFPDPDRSLVGISELLLNAVEHGNLGINYEMKTKLNGQEKLEKEVRKRLEDSVLGERKGVASYTQKEDRYVLQITDEGDGFSWRDYLDADPERVLDNHGRGIAMARMLSFDKLEYNEKGNSVTCTVFKDDLG